MPDTSYTPLQSQRDALANPAAAPLSAAPPAVPDPNFTGNTPPTGTDGAALYAAECAGCHGPLATSSKRGRTAAQIKAAIANPATGMSGLAVLSDVQIQAIATALQ